MKKVFEGVRFDVYQRDQKIFDGTTTTFEMVKRKDAVQIIAIVGNKILVPQERHPHRTTSKYGLFGGLMEEGEDFKEAAEREFLEETGMQCDLQERQIYKKEGSIARNEGRYIARNGKKIQEQCLDGGEDIQFKEMTFEERIDCIMGPDWRNKEFAFYIAQHYIYPNKLQELKSLLGI